MKTTRENRKKAASGGKDHLGTVGSMILMKKNPSWCNRVLGACGVAHQPVKINRLTGGWLPAAPISSACAVKSL